MFVGDRTMASTSLAGTAAVGEINRKPHLLIVKFVDCIGGEERNATDRSLESHRELQGGKLHVVKFVQF